MFYKSKTKKRYLVPYFFLFVGFYMVYYGTVFKCRHQKFGFLLFFTHV
jgi:hypothetical protein